MPLFRKKKTSEGGADDATVNAAAAAAGSVDDDAEVFSLRGREAASMDPSPLLDAERAASLSDKEYYDAKYAIPCSITGAMAAASGGALGFVFGFGSRLVRGVSPLVAKNAVAASAPPTTRLAAALADGRASAASFAAFGGIYSAAACAVSRARDVDADPLNGAIAGCITGAALGWKSGPAGMAQSCAMLGGFSYFIDRMQGGQVAQAAEVFVDGEEGGEEEARRQRQRRRREQQQQQRRTRDSSSCSSASSSSSFSSSSSSSSPSSSSSASGSKCCAVGGPLGAAFASAFASSYSSSSSAAATDNNFDPLSLLMGPQLKRSAEGAARKLGSVVRGAAVEQVRSRKARWEW